ncbi:MAG: hypothetical protein WC716_06845 [Chitinophagaceae bacterium]
MLAQIYFYIVVLLKAKAMDLFSVLVRNHPKSLESIREYLIRIDASEEILEYINYAIEVWNNYQPLDDGFIDLTDWSFDDEPVRSEKSIMCEIEFKIENLKKAYHDSGNEIWQEEIKYWESYDISQYPKPEKDKVEIAQDKFSMMIDFAGEIWVALRKIDFLLRNKKWGIENVEAELTSIETFNSYVYSLPAEILYSVEEELSVEEEYARELFRIKEGFYRFNQIERIGINDTTSWVYGRYIGYHYFLAGKIKQLKGEVTVRQHALLCYYKQEGDIIAPFGAFEKSKFQDIEEHALSNGIDPLEFLELYNIVSHIKTGKNVRAAGSIENLNDLKTVLSIMSITPDLGYMQSAISLISADIELAEQKFNHINGIRFSVKSIPNLHEILKTYFVEDEWDKLLTLLKGQNIEQKLLFRALQKQIAELFRRVKYNGLLTGQETNIADWIVKSFQCLSMENEIVTDLNKDYIYSVLTKAKEDISDKRKRICNVEELPYKSHVKLEDERRSS